MSIVEVFGFLASVGVGLSLGLIGGGGSILTVPILVYFFAIEPVLATTYSLFIVGTTSAVGSFAHFRQKNVNFKIVTLFGLPSLAAVFIMRRYVMSAIPHHLFYIDRWEITKPLLLMIVFAILMIIVAVTMIQNKEKSNKDDARSYPKLVFQGLIVGIITGFVGVGGGFLIIPSLVLLAKLPMKKAVGTSLAIITISSIFGGMGDIIKKVPIDYGFLAIFSAFATVGIIMGSYLTKYVGDSKLKPAFGWFILVVGVFILVTELFKHY